MYSLSLPLLPIHLLSPASMDHRRARPVLGVWGRAEGLHARARRTAWARPLMLHGRAQAGHGTCLLGSMPELRLRSCVAPRSSLARSTGKASGPPWSSSDDGEIKLMETESSRRWQEQCWRAQPWEPRRWIRRHAAAGSARQPKERGIPAAAACLAHAVTPLVSV